MNRLHKVNFDPHYGVKRLNMVASVLYPLIQNTCRVTQFNNIFVVGARGMRSETLFSQTKECHSPIDGGTGTSDETLCILGVNRQEKGVLPAVLRNFICVNGPLITFYPQPLDACILRAT